ncbi:zinc finger CCHC-type and RNA-binding motif-containing protein 1 isoform X2 [Agrilus planipennis]|nr:zinc finger CCHC-type and RNA-binding motif-containing protein 1 isoform X2 [Agrilus planipennis]
MKELFGRTLKASIANDNGRSTEFIRKRVYPDKSFCYECGAEGHLSYRCDKNLLGDREPPPKKAKKKAKKSDSSSISHPDECQYFEEDCETLGAAIALEHEKYEIENRRQEVASEEYNDSQAGFRTPKRRIKSSYFSDEEETD